MVALSYNASAITNPVTHSQPIPRVKVLVAQEGSGNDDDSTPVGVIIAGAVIFGGNIAL